MAPAARGAEQAVRAVHYASWGRRAVAYTLDVLIVMGAVMAVVAALIGITLPLRGGAVENVGVALTTALVFLGPAFYYVYFVGNERGQTYGRRACAIQVRDAETHGPIGYGRSFGRYAIVLVFGFLMFPLVFDYLWPLWDGRNQTLHDKMVRSVVLDIRPGVEERPRPELAARRGWSVGRVAFIAVGALVGAAVVAWLGVTINHAVASTVKDGAVLVCGVGGGAAVGAAVGFVIFGWRLALRGVLVVLVAAAAAAPAVGGLMVLANRQDAASGDAYALTFSDQWMFVVGAMMGATAGASIAGLAFLIWASRRVRKPEPPVGDAAPA